MIVLDTHVFLWWVVDPDRLTNPQKDAIQRHEAERIGVSAITCWEIAKLNQLGRLTLDRSLVDWLETALSYPGIELLPLTPEIAIASTQLPDGFHSDPADEMLIATARVFDCPLVTADRKVRAYPHVVTI
ncbi:MAG: type II toxin-antitoxin system VapC family toxin [Caldilineaceae bacterium]|nr:type II toxin-antitoxin system VapC family toxin [Caldilineaceae bacterium]